MATEYAATIEVKLPQLVHCIHCDCKFVYEMVVSGTGFDGTGFLRDKAEARAGAEEQAREQLDRKLNKPTLCEAIPCPMCYRYQPYMASVVAHELFTDYSGVGMPLGILVFAIIGVATICWVQFEDTRLIAFSVGVGAVVVWLIARGLLALLRWRVERYDPNTQELTQREELADSRAILLADFDEKQAKRARKEYKEFAAAVRNPRWEGKAFEKPDPLVLGWWFTPSLMLNGGSIVLELPDGDVTVHVPEDCPPGEVLDIHPSSKDVLPFQVRVLAMRVHPDEARLE